MADIAGFIYIQAGLVAVTNMRLLPLLTRIECDSEVPAQTK